MKTESSRRESGSLPLKTSLVYLKATSRLIRRPITNNANCPTAQIDAYGHLIKTLTGAKGDGTRRLHNTMNDDTPIWL